MISDESPSDIFIVVRILFNKKGDARIGIPLSFRMVRVLLVRWHLQEALRLHL